MEFHFYNFWRDMMIHRLMLALLFLFAPIAIAADEFTAGKNYEVIADAPAEGQQGKSVIEFFSYACPGCYQFEPSIEAWAAKKPKDVSFERVPVVFNPAWEAYAKAYYTAQSLKIVNKISPALFKAIHVERQDLTADGAMVAFFAKHGVSAKDFANVYDFAPGMMPRLQKGAVLLKTYEITSVPSVVVNGRYRVSRSTVKDDQEFIQVINFLLKKSD
jgi:thiol:disulfide interchange protein DsbA